MVTIVLQGGAGTQGRGQNFDGSQEWYWGTGCSTNGFMTKCGKDDCGEDEGGDDECSNDERGDGGRSGPFFPLQRQFSSLFYDMYHYTLQLEPSESGIYGIARSGWSMTTAMLGRETVQSNIYSTYPTLRAYGDSTINMMLSRTNIHACVFRAPIYVCSCSIPFHVRASEPPYSPSQCQCNPTTTCQTKSPRPNASQPRQ